MIRKIAHKIRSRSSSKCVLSGICPARDIEWMLSGMSSHVSMCIKGREMTLEELKQLSMEMQKRAYCPYSKFPVGAALECSDGTVYTGCNVENASYPVGTCAERTAICNAISGGHREFVRIVISAQTDAPCLPCGMCRQFMEEFSPDLEVICLNRHGESKTYRLGELLPCSFDKGCLLK